MTRVVPCEEPRSCPGANRSIPTTRRPRRASAASAALPMTPRPIIATSKEGIARRLRGARLYVALDLIISDFRLADGHSGIAAIEALRRAFQDAIPAFLVRGDTAPER